MKRFLFVFVILCLFVAVTPLAVLAQDDLLADENKAVVQCVIEAWNAEELTLNKLEAFINAFDDAFVWHDADRAAVQVMDQNANLAMLYDWRTAFPDAQWQTISLVAEGDLVVWHFRFQGTLMEPVTWRADLLPTGEAMQTEGLYIFRLEAGKIVDEWMYWFSPVMLSA